MPAPLTFEQFKARSLEVHGERYDYSLADFKGTKAEVLLRCREHDEEFLQKAESHMRGQKGCPSCSGRYSSTSAWVAAARQVNQGPWDYSKVVYVNNTTPVLLGCPHHGEFEQLPKTHLRGAVGCPRCGRTTPLTQKAFEDRTRELFGDRWDLAEAKYVNNVTKVKLGCKQHGTFEQSPSSLFQGKVGCPICNRKGMTLAERLGEVSPNSQWKYTSTKYVDYYTPVEIECVEHGLFRQMLDSHLKGYVGCPRCKKATSSSEQEVADFISGMFPDTQTHVRGLLGNTRQEVDIYIPSQRTAVEFHGLYYHSERFVASGKHYLKKVLASEGSIRLLQVWEDDWRDRRQLVESHIKNVLNVSDQPKIHARATEVALLTKPEAQDFLNERHLQGFSGGNIYLGLKYRGELVAASSFKSQGEDYLLNRYATSANVRGGHSKIISFFERNYSYHQLITFADLAFSYGDLYQKTGWVEDKILPPDYSYLVNGKRVHKFNYRLKRFREDPALQYKEGLTERELAELNGLLRVYDAGKIRYVKPHPSDTTERNARSAHD